MRRSSSRSAVRTEPGAVLSKHARTRAGGAKRGKIVIEYYDTDSLNRILACIENGAERRDREASAGL